MSERPAAATREVIGTVDGTPTSDGAGVKLKRLLGTSKLPGLDPFLMLDEFRSDDAADYIAGFPDHPHRGFETVTYMLAGRMRHGDNQGNTGLLGPGSVQWMTAGRGIVHSEMPEQIDGLMWGFQLWVNLPASDKMTAPRYQDIDPRAIPVIEQADGVRVKVVAGRHVGVEGAVRSVATDPQFLDIALPAGTAFRTALPAGYSAFAYVFEGAARIGDGARAETVPAGRLAVLGDGTEFAVAAAGSTAARLILVAGRPLGEPVVKYGPFVMNTEAEIHQAIRDYQSGRF
ncbi:pirin family protein [Oceanibacterium hippocampi]|uniref:pirin family protein n=1 Tax=Oceanibacterium hippocampi TaxID=745714 RepID=UPI0035224CD2